MEFTQEEKDETLKKFMLEHFDYDGLKKAGFYKNIKRKDYKAQAERVCKWFGYKSVFEYGTQEIRCHITYADPSDRTGIGTERPLSVDGKGKLKPEPFVTVLKPWTDD